MGFLHEGHLQLVDHARTRSTCCVMSIFVNPAQFGPTEDLSRYPRDPHGDTAKALSRGVDILFTPSVREMYGDNRMVSVVPNRGASRWEGALRPGHFEGVLSVVAKLFNIVQPQVAVFGQKDAQQAALVRAMVRDLNIPVDLLVAPIVRDADGLALSSRNVYLSPDERLRAVQLPRALHAVRECFSAGERNASQLEQAGRTVLDAQPGLSVDYFAVVNAIDLEPVLLASPGSLVLAAVKVGATRLLDNLVLGEP